MRKAKQIAIISVLAGVFFGTFAPAQTAKTQTKTDDAEAKAEAAIKEQLRQLIRYYEPTEDQKAKLKEVLLAQYKDIQDQDKVRGPKIKVLDEELAAVKKKIEALEKEAEAIEKRKDVYEKSREELLLDHKAEIANVFTTEQRIARLSSYIRSRAIYGQHWSVLPKATQAALQAKCEQAALELITAGKTGDSKALNAACHKVRENANKVLTPELKKAGESEYLYTSAMRKFARIKLTDAQKAAVKDMCDQTAERKTRVYAKYAQLSKDLEALRRTRYGMSSSSVYYKIRQDVVDKVLTDEQVKAGGFKRKTTSEKKF